MKMGIHRGAVLGLALAMLAMAPQAWGFYPLGGYNAAGVLKFMTWPLNVMDTNLDGDVSGANEGVGLIFESGDLGFTDAQIVTAMAGFEHWEEVTTSYAAYYFKDKTPDPLELLEGSDTGSVDGVNYVAFEFAETTDADIIGDDTLALALLTYAVDETQITIGNQTVTFSGGQMIEADFVINGDILDNLADDSFDAPGTTSDNQEGIEGTATWLGGFGLGLQDSALVNLTDEFFDEDDNLVSGKEDRVVYLLDQFGVPQHVGVTSSLVNFSFGYTDNTQSRTDLAPDDIAGITFLYPRANQTNFFTLSHEARTTRRVNLPSAPLEGAHIRAWADADDNETTTRVPFTDTLTGLYTQNPEARGRFNLYNLFKQLPDEDGVLFEPTYAITVSPLDDDVEWGQELSDFDSTSNGEGNAALTFADLFSSEVFNEERNILADENVNEGTPLVFSAARNAIVSADTGKTLAQMLPGTTPMFGARNDICFYNVVIAGLGVMQGPEQLRYFRDNVLLPTALGTAMAETYYQVAPAVSRFLIDHPTAMAAGRGVAKAIDWALTHRYVFLLPMLTVLIALVAWRRPKLARLGLMALVLATPMLLALPADAQMIPQTQADLVKGADEVVGGTVVAVESHWTANRRIVTDVTVSVTETVKGKSAKGGEVKLQVLGGQIGNLVQYVTLMPRFKTGEEVILFLAKRKTKDASEPVYRLKGNFLGKQKVETDETTKEKFVVKPSLTDPPEPAFGEAPKKSAKAVEEEKAKRIPYDEQIAKLRSLVEEQKAK